MSANFPETSASLLNVTYFFGKRDRYPNSRDIASDVPTVFDAPTSPTEEKDKDYITGRV